MTPTRRHFLAGLASAIVSTALPAAILSDAAVRELPKIPARG